MPLKNILLFVAAALLIAVILSYAILIKLEAAAKLTIQDLEGEILKAATREDRQAEQKVLGYEKKIKSYADLSAKSKKVSQFFENFENLIHPQVLFSSLEVTAGSLRAAVKGKTASFQTLEQQLIFLGNQKDIIESVDLTDINLNKEGGADFSLNLTLKPEIFDAIKQ